jgi:PDZ domain
MGVIILIAIVVLVGMGVMNKIADSMMNRTRRQAAIGRQVQAGLVVFVAIIALLIYSKATRKESPPRPPSVFDGIDLKKKPDFFAQLSPSSPVPKISPETYGGVGIVLTKKEGSGDVIIESCSDQSPAMKAGLRKDDVVTAIDDVSVVGKTVADVVALGRGAPGTKVIFTIRRNGGSEERITMERALIQVVDTPSPPGATPKRVKLSYSGTVGRATTKWDLEWDNDTVTGTYYYLNETPRINYRLQGTHVSGVLQLDEYTNDVFSAHISLVKRSENDEIIWDGQMHNADGRYFKMTMKQTP